MKKLVSSLVALTLLLALLPACKEAAQTPGPTAPGAPQEDSYTFSYADTIAWDAEYDVVVVGFGGAGATASIAASEAGANVLLTEKAPQGEEGGNSKVCYQIILNYTDYDDGVAYLKQECEGYDNMTDELIDRFVKGNMGKAAWLSSAPSPPWWPGSTPSLRAPKAWCSTSSPPPAPPAASFTGTVSTPPW